MKSLVWPLFFVIASIPLRANCQSKPQFIDLTHAVVVSFAKPNTVEAKAVQMLVEEVEKRTRIRWPVNRLNVNENRATIMLGTAGALHFERRAGAVLSWDFPEGYRIQTSNGSKVPSVSVFGADPRGVLFGVGRLLRNVRLERDRITIPANLNIASK